jgi:hypothetical protein
MACQGRHLLLRDPDECKRLDPKKFANAGFTMIDLSFALIVVHILLFSNIQFGVQLVSWQGLWQILYFVPSSFLPVYGFFVGALELTTARSVSLHQLVSARSSA